MDKRSCIGLSDMSCRVFRGPSLALSVVCLTELHNASADDFSDFLCSSSDQRSSITRPALRASSFYSQICPPATPIVDGSGSIEESLVMSSKSPSIRSRIRSLPSFSEASAALILFSSSPLITSLNAARLSSSLMPKRRRMSSATLESISLASLNNLATSLPISSVRGGPVSLDS